MCNRRTHAGSNLEGKISIHYLIAEALRHVKFNPLAPAMSPEVRFCVGRMLSAFPFGLSGNRGPTAAARGRLELALINSREAR